MTNTYKFGLQSPPLVAKSLDGLTNVIVAVHWTYDAMDDTGEYAAHRYDGPLELSVPSPANFIPFEQVTPDMLNGWIAAELGDRVAVLQAGMDADITAQIAAAANPATPVPMELVAAAVVVSNGVKLLSPS